MNVKPHCETTGVYSEFWSAFDMKSYIFISTMHCVQGLLHHHDIGLKTEIKDPLPGFA